MTSDWYALSGAPTLRAASAVSFREYAQRARSANRSTPALEDDRRQIELDLARARASVREFILCVPADDCDGGDEEEEDEALAPHVAMLRDILLAYSARNPRVGYVQGHADVVCFLIGNINERRDEEEVFWVYASIIERVFPEDFFARLPKLHGFQVDNRLFKELVARKLDDGGAILHLLLALHFVQSAVDGLVARNAEPAFWDASRLYQIVLESSQDATAALDPHALLLRGQSTLGLSEAAVEDMRITLRLDPQLQRLELAELVRSTQFSAAELTRLHEEFTFLRFHAKALERAKLRGVRQELFESVLAREFSTWPVDIGARLFQVMKPDGYGNASFSSLAQMCGSGGFWTVTGSTSSQAVADTSPHPLCGAERDAFLRNNPAQSPLLRVQFRRKLEALAAERGTLDWDRWFEAARTDREILSLMDWDVFDRRNSAADTLSSHPHPPHPHHRKQQHSGASTTTLLSPIEGGHYTKATRPPTLSNGSLSPETASTPSTLSAVERAETWRSVSLLSKPMAQKFKVSRALIAGDGALRRSPFEAQFPAGHAATSSQTQMHWCQCAIS
ncbi:hypothetical protein PybrP1_013192 [[Pythium] brassicae (nom. inval.)]|nr:hypothetical protein PybrP1_013192 [[Pythium] brassicae (nom. inval.)]